MAKQKMEDTKEFKEEVERMPDIPVEKPKKVLPTHILKNTVHVNGIGYCENSKIGVGLKSFTGNGYEPMGEELFNTLCCLDNQAEMADKKIYEGSNTKIEVMMDGTMHITKRY